MKIIYCNEAFDFLYWHQDENISLEKVFYMSLLAQEKDQTPAGFKNQNSCIIYGGRWFSDTSLPHNMKINVWPWGNFFKTVLLNAASRTYKAKLPLWSCDSPRATQTV